MFSNPSKLEFATAPLPLNNSRIDFIRLLLGSNNLPMYCSYILDGCKLF